jgi:hypothetical protein
MSADTGYKMQDTGYMLKIAAMKPALCHSERSEESPLFVQGRLRKKTRSQ